MSFIVTVYTNSQTLSSFAAAFAFAVAIFAFITVSQSSSCLLCKHEAMAFIKITVCMVIDDHDDDDKKEKVFLGLVITYYSTT